MGEKLGRLLSRRNLESNHRMISIGGLFYCWTSRRFFFVLRGPECPRPNTWGLVGGKLEHGETLINGLHREISEEIGYLPDIAKTIPIDTYENNGQSFKYYTWLLIIDKEFIPQLNYENQGYAWVSFNGWPKPLHPGLYASFNEELFKQKISTIIDLDFSQILYSTQQ